MCRNLIFLYLTTMNLKLLTDIDPKQLESTAVLRKTTAASRKLAELKGVAASIPNQAILINTLVMQEAKDSSEIENIITTHDELFKGNAFPEFSGSSAAKEVRNYIQALYAGYQLVRKTELFTLNHIEKIHAELEQNTAGFRQQVGTALKNRAGETIYTPPQDHATILALMSDLEHFINDDTMLDADPLIKMALIHHRFESIHPFYDGNGRTGRIINVLYLMQKELLDIPILYLSRYIVRNKNDYYRLLQSVRNDNQWEPWLLYMLTGVEETAQHAINTIDAIKIALMDYKHRIRDGYKFYSQDLINNLFKHPYTKIEFVEKDLNVSRITATKYLDTLAKDGFLEKKKIGRVNYYINTMLYKILMNL